jgi:hypothetical protein
MFARKRNKRVFDLEALEGRIALSGNPNFTDPSGFGQQVSDQAQDPSILSAGLKNFGQWQSDVAHANGGLGGFNNAQDGAAKVPLNNP